MHVNDRPGLGPVWLLVCGLVTITLVFVRFPAGWNVPGSLYVVAVVILAVVALGMARPLMKPFDPAVRGVVAILLAWGTGATLMFFIAKGSRTWSWLHFVLLLALLGVTAWVVSAEWSQRWFLAMSALLVLLIGSYIVRLGYSEERALRVERPIKQAVQDKVALTARAIRDQAESRVKLLAAKRKAEEDLLLAVTAAPPGFRDAGRTVLEHLVAKESNLPAARVELARVFALGVPQANQVEAQSLRDKAKAAVDQHSAADPSLPDAKALDEALNEACARARASNLDPKECPEATNGIPGNEAPAPPDTEPGLRRLAVELAYYRAAVTKADADKVAAEAAAKAPPTELEVPLWDSFLAGPEAIVESIRPNDPLRLVPGPVGWLLLGATILAFLRVLRKRNASQVAGPVQVDYTGDYKAELRIALLSNLPTPASAPGATLLQSVTDLSSLAGPGGKTLETLIKVVNGVLARGPGYIVEADVAPPPKSPPAPSQPTAPSALPPKSPAVPPEPTAPSALPPKSPAVPPEPTAPSAPLPKSPASSDGKETPSLEAPEPKPPTRVLVSVSLGSAKEFVANRQFEHEVPERAIRAAGLWAAGLILGRSTRIPSWASWNQQTAKALATASTDDPKLTDLEEAVRAAPTSGIVLQLYGGALELEGRAFEAIAVYARAVAMHPRYLPARYRLAVSLGMASRDISKWDVVSLSDRDAILHAVRQATKRLGIQELVVDKLAGPEPKRAFEELAEALLQTLEDDASWWNAVSASLRRRDRDDIWRPSAMSRLPWRRWKNDRLRAKSARLAYTRRDNPKIEAVLNDIEEAADDPLISWQLSYNLACYYAQTNEGEALRRLEDCLVRPDVHELTAEWVGKDPDLAPIAGHPRFKRFRVQLQGKA